MINSILNMGQTPYCVNFNGPPGTGKTLMCFWIANGIKDDDIGQHQKRNILIAVPSLHLLNDTFLVWNRECIAHGIEHNFLLIGRLL